MNQTKTRVSQSGNTAHKQKPSGLFVAVRLGMLHKLQVKDDAQLNPSTIPPFHPVCVM